MILRKIFVSLRMDSWKVNKTDIKSMAMKQNVKNKGRIGSGSDKT